jgi:ketosteroid isomerase-like protein
MRRATAVMIVLTAFAQPAMAQTAVASIRRLDSAWARSYAIHDTSFARALFADSLVVTSGSGAVKDREGELADIRPTADLAMRYFRTQDVVVHAYGPSAVVIGLAEWSFTAKERTTTLRRRYTATYVRGGRLGWQMVGLHLGAAPG